MSELEGTCKHLNLTDAWFTIGDSDGYSRIPKKKNIGNRELRNAYEAGYKRGREEYADVHKKKSKRPTPSK